MASIRGRDTKPELQVRKFLHGCGFRYKLTTSKGLPGKPDVVLPHWDAAVFVHGCFWHGHEGCRFATVPATRTDFWVAKIESNKNRDVLAVMQLRKMGWRVATIWECALRTNANHSLKRLASFITSKRKKVDISGPLHASK